MQRNRKYEGIIILGCPRSGTTLLRRLLNAHSNIAAPGETHILTACARFLHSDRAVDGMNVGVLNGLGYAGFETQEVLDRLREFAFTFRRQHAAREGKARWVEKTAVDAFYINEISRLFGDHALFICITRHGMDVACSMMDWCDKSQVYFSELYHYVRQYPRPLEAFCHAWVDVTRDLRKFVALHQENSLELRYEDLVANPEAEMRRVLDFIGEPWDSGLLSRAMHHKDSQGFSDWKTFSKSQIETTSVGRWRKFSSPTLADLALIVNPSLLECGYDAIESGETDSEEEAKRRYELGLLFQAMKPETPMS
ncbi:sulfotransferase [Candidatus Nitronereus thalassa]|uniref:Sulfotransferase n=1 Tax=Candidatus Nitronereus thalassa TaxID=3020898 RepID=A0ABU3K559_9BACT|nr:sulfotransferase [Candidatus Nitronereus thalassa]MDT7041531.1 sulfotransferase [Candidatus Nitronereus thalassa]